MKIHITWLYFEIDILRQFWRPLMAFTRHWRLLLLETTCKMAEMGSATQRKKAR